MYGLQLIAPGCPRTPDVADRARVVYGALPPHSSAEATEAPLDPPCVSICISYVCTHTHTHTYTHTHTQTHTHTEYVYVRVHMCVSVCVSVCTMAASWVKSGVRKLLQTCIECSDLRKAVRLTKGTGTWLLLDGLGRGAARECAVQRSETPS